MGASTADPRLFLPGVPEVYSSSDDDDPLEFSQPFFRGHYVDLSRLPLIRKHFEKGLFNHYAGNLRRWERERAEHLMFVSKHVRKTYGDDYDCGIPVWIEWSGSRGKRSFLHSVWRDTREVRVEIHDSAVWSTHPFDDRPLHYHAINQANLTYEVHYNLTRPWLFDPESQHVPLTYFAGWPIDLLDALWRILYWNAGMRHPPEHRPQSGGWHFGPQMIGHPPYMSRPTIMWATTVAYSLLSHTEWGSTEEMMNHHYGYITHQEAVGRWKRQKVIEREKVASEDDTPITQLYEYPY